jgi:hypothetical protein
MAQAQLRQRPVVAAPSPGVPDMSLVPVSVIDPYGRFVTGLDQDAFQVFEDGVEQKIVRFIRDNEPASLAIVWGLKGGLALRTTNTESELLMVPLDGNESLLDGIHAGITRLAGLPNRRTGLVIVYDGAEPATLWPENEINETVRNAGMPVYAIGLTDPIMSKAAGPTSADTLLQLIANATGGREYSGVTPDKVPGIMEQIGVETANGYVLGYIPIRPPDNGKYHGLDIRLKEPRGLPPLTVRFRAGFYDTAR